MAQDVLGHDVLVDIFKTAHGLDPAAKLGLNDYGDIASWDTKHQEAFLAEIQYLLDHGAPMKVIGLQSHFGSSVRDPAEVLKLLDRFASFGLPLRISELDINTLDEAMQADYTRDIFIALFSHPAVEKITQWGFWKGRRRLPYAALWRKDWSIKPNGQATLIWWTSSGAPRSVASVPPTANSPRAAFWGATRSLPRLRGKRRRPTCRWARRVGQSPWPSNDRG